MYPESQIQSDQSFGQNMMNQSPSSMPMPSSMPQPESPDPSQAATGMAKGVASVRQSLMQLAQEYPEFSKLADETIQRLTDTMYKSMVRQPSSEGQEMTY